MSKKCKVFALYLPQFHQIRENDEWWGKGFTEWDSVKAAKKLSKFSIQPRIPLEGYYDLSQVKTLRDQANVANRYKVDGFVIYHYYSNGQMLLEKPAELLFENKDIKISFFFSWANHDWRRTWYGYNLEVLRKQEYGNTSQIREHYKYLSKFFSDNRYLKINNKPVFAIYRYSTISNINEYYNVWNEMAKEEGYDGIYFIQTIDNLKQERDQRYFSAAFDFVPGYIVSGRLFNKERVFNRLRSFLVKRKLLHRVAQFYDYEKVVNAIINNKHTDSHQYYGVFRGWDNTPRHSYMGTVYKNESVEEFERQFSAQYKKALLENHDLLIINSWNEWSEGAYLEADEHSGYAYLESIKRVVSLY